MGNLEGRADSGGCICILNDIMIAIEKALKMKSAVDSHARHDVIFGHPLMITIISTSIRIIQYFQCLKTLSCNVVLLFLDYILSTINTTL